MNLPDKCIRALVALKAEMLKTAEDSEPTVEVVPEMCHVERKGTSGMRHARQRTRVTDRMFARMNERVARL